MAHIVSALAAQKRFRPNRTTACNVHDATWRASRCVELERFHEHPALFSAANDTTVGNMLSLHEAGAIRDKDAVERWFTAWFRTLYTSVVDLRHERACDARET